MNFNNCLWWSLLRVLFANKILLYCEFWRIWKVKGHLRWLNFLVPLLNLSFHKQVENDISGSCDHITYQTQKISRGNDLLFLHSQIIAKFENVSWTVMLTFGIPIQCQCFLRLQICKQACSDLYTRMTFGPVCSDLLEGINARLYTRLSSP